MPKKTQAQQTGTVAEKQAMEYLQSLGYEILERNFRHLKGEIDIIALWENKLLVFVEVKARYNLSFGEPESFVSSTQERLILSTAEEYIFSINWKRDIRFDIIGIDLKNHQLEHFIDSFY